MSQASDRRERIDRLLAEAVSAGVVPGVVAAATDRSATLYEAAFGPAARSDGSAIATDSLFWVASMTKAVAAVAAMQLIEQGRLSLDAEVGGIVPGLASPQVLTGFDPAGDPVLRPARTRITLRHLLTHTAGFGYDTWNPLLRRYVAHPATKPALPGMLAALDRPLIAEPGAAWEYGIAIDWVGRVVEAVSGQSLDAYFDAHVFAPLGMRDTCFRVPSEKRARLALMHRRADDGTLHPIDRAPPDYPEFFPAGGGLHSTAPDYLRFLRMLLNDGAPILRPETLALMAENHIGALPGAGVLRSANPAMSHDFVPFDGAPAQWGLSFLINATDLPTGRRAGSLAWAGMANCYYWADRASGLAGLLLTQILPFADPAVLRLFAAFETAVYRHDPTIRR